MKSDIRVIVVDDHELVRAQLVAMLSKEPDIELVGVATNGQEAVTLARSVEADVIVMDIYMPGLDGMQATREIRAPAGAPQVIMLSMHQSAALVQQARRNGASGYVYKQDAYTDLVPAIRTAYKNRLAR